jgi:signal transduction histidine kinase
MLEISVQDTGVGISDEDLPRLFNLHQKLSKEGTNKEKGTGLGLIICKDFVEKQGGTLQVESRHGKGSVFRFTIPLA